MKYVSLDLETTGLNPDTCQVLEIAAILEDTTRGDRPLEDLPSFHAVIHWPYLQGESFALRMNWPIVLEAADHGREAAEVWHEFELWLSLYGVDKSTRGVLAGKNVAGFDRRFLPMAVSERFHHRTIDPGSVLIDWDKETPPSLGELTGRAVTHRAMEDARDVVRVLRELYA